MANILILGAGVMGSALAVPASDNGHAVTLVGTPLDSEPVARMKQPGGVHPKLDEPLSPAVRILADDELRPDHMAEADLVVIGVSSPGVSWAVQRLNETLKVRKPVAFVTKGLERRDGRVVSYADIIPDQVPTIETFIGIGGPCIARELANRYPTLSVYASTDVSAAAFAAGLMRTRYYRLDTSTDATGVECCAALKNFYAIGVSAMQTRYPDPGRSDGQSKNPTAGSFTQAMKEMASLCREIGGEVETAHDLAGMGDLHVTVGGGRNSRLGHGLGQGRVVSDIMGGELSGETVEGIDTARVLAGLIETIPDAGHRYPLAVAIIRSVLEGERFDFAFDRLYG